jgi:hypothetical protein
LSKFSLSGSIENLAKVLVGVSTNTTLEDVVISNTPNNESLKLDDPANLLSPAFDQCFKLNNTLKKLVIENFKIGPESFPGISEGLSANSALQSLCLKGNCIGWHEICCLVEGLRKNGTLMSLDVSESPFIRAASEDVKGNCEGIFAGLMEMRLKNLQIDGEFWNMKGIPGHLAKLVSGCKDKYSL